MQAKVTSKGQVTLPKPIRTRMTIRTGDRLEFSLDSSNRLSVRKKSAPGSSAGCGRLFLAPNQKPPSVEEMNEAIRAKLKSKFGDRQFSKP